MTTTEDDLNERLAQARTARQKQEEDKQLLKLMFMLFGLQLFAEVVIATERSKPPVDVELEKKIRDMQAKRQRNTFTECYKAMKEAGNPEKPK